jgi:hypothetical protein
MRQAWGYDKCVALPNFGRKICKKEATWEDYVDSRIILNRY